jgi:hypothetical protein
LGVWREVSLIIGEVPLGDSNSEVVTNLESKFREENEWLKSNLVALEHQAKVSEAEVE